MDKLTDFNDTSDVSDAAIEWVTSHGTWCYERPPVVRDHSNEGYSEDRAIILAARLIQQHRPDLLVDPVDAIVREELARAYEDACLDRLAGRVRCGELDQDGGFIAGKRLYLMGLEAGKKS